MQFSALYIFPMYQSSKNAHLPVMWNIFPCNFSYSLKWTFSVQNIALFMVIYFAINEFLTCGFQTFRSYKTASHSRNFTTSWKPSYYERYTEPVPIQLGRFTSHVSWLSIIFKNSLQSRTSTMPFATGGSLYYTSFSWVDTISTAQKFTNCTQCA